MRYEGDVFPFFFSFFFPLPSSSPIPFSAKSRGNFVHGTMGHVAEAVANFGMSAALRPVLGAFQPSSRGTPTGPFPELLACRLSPGCGISVSVYSPPLCLSVAPSLSNHQLVRLTPLSLAPTISPVPRCCPLPPLPRITANNECIRNPTFLCPSVARFFVS